MNTLKMKTTATLLIAMFMMLMMVVVTANADLTGYEPAPYPGSWTVSPCTWKWVDIDEGAARRWWTHATVNNVGDFPLNEAKVTIKVFRVNYDPVWDETQKKWIWKHIANPKRIGELVHLLNGESIGINYYELSLGTVQPGHSHQQLLNFWVSTELGPMSWNFRINVYYLPLV